MIIVTLDIFSGRENPKWMLSEAAASSLQNLLNPLFSKKQKYLISKDSTEKIPSLGYRGFLLKGELEIGKRNHSIRIFEMKEIENFLLETGEKNIPLEIYSYVKDKLNFQSSSKKTVPRSCPPCNAIAAPTFGSLSWTALHTKLNNNCYNYATNLITNTFAQPGKNSGITLATLTASEVESSAISDGLITTGNFSDPLPSGHYVALVIWPGLDFHWYRQDSIGCWSHKAGTTDVTDKDNKNNYISDPKKCDLGPYTFHAFMICQTGVAII